MRSRYLVTTLVLLVAVVLPMTAAASMQTAYQLDRPLVTEEGNTPMAGQ